ncbi:MAG: protein rep [Ruminococcus flavefaciens]|nr:protein rep [Ruminococcus flavefaciens]
MNFTECLRTADLELQNSFKESKIYTRYLYQSYYRLHSKNCSFGGFDFKKMSDTVRSCAKFLKFKHTDTEEVKLHKSNFCRDRLCPMCASRRSKKIYSQVHSCVDYMKNDYQFIMLTLTVRNCSANALSDTISYMNNSFNKMIKYKAFNRICRGCLKCLEITYNRERDDYHPHFHVLIAVDNNYFKSDSYLHQSDYLAMWQKATKDYSITQVDVRKIHYNPNRPELSDISSAVAEVAKYAIKPTDYLFPDNLFLTDKVVYTLSTCLKNRRTFSFRGIFDKVHKLLGLDDAFDGDLIHTDENVKDGEVVFYSSYVWSHGRYHLYAIEVPNKFVLTCSHDFFVDLQTCEILVE